MSDAISMMKDAAERIEPLLQKVFPEDLSTDITVKAAYYSLLAGGKRIRPCFMYQVTRMIGRELSQVDDFACALEMIHTYSLIHDDLPAMDNDDLRRGNPTCHKKFGEDIAILAGDALLNRAFELLFKASGAGDGALSAASNIASLAGICGMIGGQSIDVSSEGKNISLDTLYTLQEKKTGALIEAAFVTPCILFGCDEKTTSLIRKLAGHVGLSFQISDDILDVVSSEEDLGKTTGKDERDNKSTFVTLLGLDGARARLDEEISSSYSILDSLSDMGFETDHIRPLVGFIAERNF